MKLPLVLRGFIDEYTETIEFVRIVQSEYETGPDPNRPNTLCELLLQLLHAGPHHLPDCSKPELIDSSGQIKLENSPGYRRLCEFVAGNMTWGEANVNDRGDKRTPDSQETRLNNEISPQPTAKKALRDIIKQVLPLVNILICTTAAAASGNYTEFLEKADVCVVEEAGAMSCPEVFAGWRGIGQVLIASGDTPQFGPFELGYAKHKFQEYVYTSTLDMIKTAGYPIFQLNTQHRAIDGQYDPVYSTFYKDIKLILSPDSQHPSNHPDAQRVEAAFVADCVGLQASHADRIIPMFINVPNSDCDQVGTSRRNPEQTEAALRVVEKLISCNIKHSDILVIGAYRAEFIELRRNIPEDVFVTTVDTAQGRERSYVVLVFSTTEKTGLGFTGNPHRLCVSMSRQMAFLALIGDIETVKNAKYAGTSLNIYLERIHEYFVTHKRVGKYRDIKALQDTTHDPQPSIDEVRDEEEERLQAQVDAAIAALRDYQASKAKKSAAEMGEDSGLV